MKECRKCKQIFSFDKFQKNNRVKNRISSWCKVCANQKAKSFRDKHPTYSSEYETKRNKLAKFKVINHYSKGDLCCSCCGERTMEFLSIDHINGGGTQHRKTLGAIGKNFYRWLSKENYPEGYRVLCHNCNQSYGNHKYCPHQNKNKEVDGWSLAASTG